MKKILILILAFTAAGGFAEMTKTQWKAKLFADAQDLNGECSLKEAESILKEKMIQKGFSQEEIISIAKEYQSLYPSRKEGANFLDFELRNIKSLNYFTGYAPVEVKVPDASSGFSMPWWGWALVVLGGGGLLYAFSRKRS